MDINDIKGKTLEEIEEALLKGENMELDMDSLEQVSGGTRDIRSREQLLRVMNGGDVHMFLEMEKKAKDAQAALRAAPLSSSTELLAQTAAIQLEYGLMYTRLVEKYNSGTVVPTPDGDIIIPD